MHLILESNSLKKYLFDEQIAMSQLNEMRTKISQTGTKALVWYFNKTMRYALQGLYVDMKGVEMVKKLLADN